MKNLKKMVTVLVTVAMMISVFSTVAFAAEINWEGPYVVTTTVNYGAGKTAAKTGDSIYVEFALDQDMEISNDANNILNLYFPYNAEIVEYVGATASATSGITASSVKNTYGPVQYANEAVPAVSFTANEAFLTLEFKVIAEAGTYNDVFYASDENDLFLASCGIGTGDMSASNGTATYVVDGTVVVEADAPPVTPSTASISKTMKTIVGNEATYNNVWVGTINVVLGNDGVTGVKATWNNGTADKETATYAVDGDGGVTATVAIVGAPETATVDAVLVY